MVDPGDELAAYIDDRSRREPGFDALVEAAVRRREFARSLAAQRKKKHLTQTLVAARMRTSPAMVVRIESGADVRVSTMERYAAALGTELQLGIRRGRRTARRSASRRPRR